MDADLRRCPGGKDLISDLPDDLLRNILVHLTSTAEAARSSLLSRRWRHVWTYVPEIVLHCNRDMPASCLDSFDAAFHACSAPTFRRIKISLYRDNNNDIHRVAPWLQFASQRLVGTLDLSLYPRYAWGEDELMLPLCERATGIKLSTSHRRLLLRPPASATFTALTNLDIYDLRVDGRDLERFVSLQCPCLQNLRVVGHLVADRDITITSESLKHLRYRASGTNKFNVTTPELTEISLDLMRVANIIAPKLERIDWKSDTYNPSSHEFVGTSRHLRLLGVKQSSAKLMQRFDTVNELRLSLSISKGKEGYMSFQKSMDKLPTCRILWLSVSSDHRITPIIFHLLDRCCNIRKLELYLDPTPPMETTTCRAGGCPCRLPIYYRADSIKFVSIEEIKICSFNGSVKQEEFVLLLLSRCNPEILKRVDISVQFYRVQESNEKVCRRIRRICNENTKVEFGVSTPEGMFPYSV